MFTALAMPMLIGFSGLAVDVAQWYMWKRELQFAVDQAAIAGAFAYSDDEVSSTYLTRAEQEFTANISITDGVASTPTITLVDWDGGTDNAIEVVASVTRALPFSSLFLPTPPAISAKAWATFEGGSGAIYSACLVALNETVSKAVNFHGNPTVDSGCGLASLSTASNSINVSGSPGTYNMGEIYTAGGVSDGHDNFAGSVVHESFPGLTDPFEGITPPDSATSRTLSCSVTDVPITADVQNTTVRTYDYYRGPSKNNSVIYVYASARLPVTQTQVQLDVSFTSPPSSEIVTSETWTQVGGNGQNKIWEREVTTSSTLYVNVTNLAETVLGMLPGTYSDFNLGCDTTMEAGIYVIDGGMLSVNAQTTLSGYGVMFILKNGAGIKINGGAEVNLTGISEAQLIAAGVSYEDAAVLDGMLIFEDRTSGGNSQNKINGNAGLSLSGTIYLPSSPISLLGTMSGVSRCLNIVADTIEIGGTADLNNLCPIGTDPDPIVYEDRDQVRLVL